MHERVFPGGVRIHGQAGRQAGNSEEESGAAQEWGRERSEENGVVSGRESAMRQHAAGKAAALGPWTAVAAAATVESIAAATGAMQSQPRVSPALRLHPNRSHGPVCRGTKIGAHEFPARVPGVRSEPACAGSPHAARDFVRAHIRKGPSGGRDGECREHPDPGGLCATLAAAARTGGGGVFCDAKRRAGWVCRRGGELTSGGGAEDRDTVLRFKEAAYQIGMRRGGGAKIGRRNFFV